MIVFKIFLRDVFLVLLGGFISPMMMYCAMNYYGDWTIWDHGVLLHALYFGVATFLAYVGYRLYEYKPETA